MAKLTGSMNHQETPKASALLNQEQKGVGLCRDAKSASELGLKKGDNAALLKYSKGLLSPGDTNRKNSGGNDADDVSDEVVSSAESTGKSAKKWAKKLEHQRRANGALHTGRSVAKGAGQAGAKVAKTAGATAAKGSVAAASGAATAGVGTVVTVVVSGAKKRLEEKNAQAALTRADQVKGQVIHDAAGSDVSTGKGVAANLAAAVGGLVTVKAATLPLLGAAAPVLIVVMVTISIVLGLSTVTSALSNSQTDTDLSGLQGNARIIAEYLHEKEVDALHIAAILGNIYQESGYNAGSLEGATGEVWGQYRGHGICQWTAERWDGSFAGWTTGLKQYAAAAGKDWTDIQVQLDYFWAEVSAPTVTGGTGQGAAAPYARGQMTASGRTWNDFLATSDLEEATEFFMRAFELHNWTLNRESAQFTRRYTEAERVYELIAISQIGQGTETQQAVATEAVFHTRYDGRHKESGWCLAWVSCVYENSISFYPKRHYTAADAARATERFYTKDDIPVGAAVFGLTSSAGGAGHIGIYVGGGMVCDQMGTRPHSLETFIAGVGWGGWGWLDGKDLSKGS